MSGTVQNYLAEAAVKAAEELIVAIKRIPEDKLEWKPAETSRTAHHMFIECVLLTGYTADVIRTHTFPADMMQRYSTDTAAVSTLDIDTLSDRLRQSTATVAAAIREVPDTDLGVDIVMPWQTQALSETIAYPYWNMSYHLGQINYIASQLGCLD